ncbi:signal peptidase I [uncultured Aquimarina sp.]|uniref:signal peptidase I n=1 Tax=uncultured Aquimarina sp. TaxID=575652 RepID=UPI0026122299|nr:signal peptidase I [uncultured Aquimarina sp.]
MDKNSKILLGTLLFVVSIFLYIAFGTDVYRFYTNSSAANEPNLPINSKVVVSIFIKPKRLDFVCYKHTDSLWGNNKRIHRLVGIPNDTLEIKNGVLYVNRKNVDSIINLVHSYKIQEKVAKKLAQNKELITLFDDRSYYQSNNDSVIAFMSDRIAKRNNLESFKQIISKGKIDQHIKNQFGMNWNIDNFGPLVLKEKEYFVIGDNRHNSEDSRMIGIIDESKIIGKATRF